MPLLRPGRRRGPVAHGATAGEHRSRRSRTKIAPGRRHLSSPQPARIYPRSGHQESCRPPARRGSHVSSLASVPPLSAPALPNRSYPKGSPQRNCARCQNQTQWPSTLFPPASISLLPRQAAHRSRSQALHGRPPDPRSPRNSSTDPAASHQGAPNRRPLRKISHELNRVRVEHDRQKEAA